MTDQLIGTFVHLKKKPKAEEALDLLRRVAAHVKPIMKAHHWHVKTLAEFLPTQTNLLGTNYGKGIKISLRLRHHYNDSEFLPFDDIMGTMLHELSHNVQGPHDAKFYALLDDLNLEYDALLRKGIKGDDGDSVGGRARTIEEARKVAAEKAISRARGTGKTGRQLGGDKVLAATLREKVAVAAQRRLHDAKWCGHGRAEDPILVDEEEESLNRDEESGSKEVSKVVDVNEQIVAAAKGRAMLSKTSKPIEVIEIPSDDEAEEMHATTKHASRPSSIINTKIEGTKRALPRTTQESDDFIRMKDRGLIADSLYDHLKKIKMAEKPVARDIPLGKWQCGLCTLLNPLRAEQCAACEAERPANSQQVGDHWVCEQCLQFNEKDRWMCHRCQFIKRSS